MATRYFEGGLYHAAVTEDLALHIIRGSSPQIGDVILKIEKPQQEVFMKVLEDALLFIENKDKIQKLKEKTDVLPKYMTALCFDDFTSLLNEAQVNVVQAVENWGIPSNDLLLLLKTYNEIV